MREGPGRRSRRPSALTAATLAIALALVGNLATNTVQVQARWWPWAVWTATAVLIGAALLAEHLRHRADWSATAAADLHPLADALAREVEAQWKAEAVFRHVRQPMPLRVRWSSTIRPVAAGRDVVLGGADQADWLERPLTGGVEDLFATFQNLPHRQLVVLGEPGAGKSVLAMLLTLGLLECRDSADPVPVLLPIAAWDPTTEAVERFIVRRLAEEHDFLGGGTEAGLLSERLLGEDRLIPVLDGLDELATRHQPAAIEALDEFAASGRPLVVTCRTREYEHAVARSGHILSRAAVVEIQPVDVDQAIEFLSHPAPARTRWQPVFEKLRADPGGVLANVLSTPLMVSLARTAYLPPATDPVDLLKLPGRTAVEGALIDGFVTSVYRSEPRGSSGRFRRRYDPVKARRWLSYIAYQLYRTGAVDLWWWRIDPGLLSPRPQRSRVLLSRTTVQVIGSVTGLITLLLAGPRYSLWAAFAATVIAGSGAAGLTRIIWPSRYSPPFLRLRRPRVTHVLIGVVLGLLVSPSPLGLIGGALCGLTTRVMPRWSPEPRARRATPEQTLHANHLHALTTAFQYGGTAGLIFAALAGLGLHRTGTLPTAGAAAVVYGLAAGFSAGLWTWIRFRIVHLALAARGWLPLRLWAFLNDAHRRGVLRQAGTAWQFRHALLQNHLADRTRPVHLRIRADAGDGPAHQQLMDLLVAQDRADELRVRADNGDQGAAIALARLRARHGRVDEALNTLRAQADAGDWNAVIALVRMLAEHDRVDELQAHIDGGGRGAVVALAALQAQHGRVDEPGAPAGVGDLETVMLLTRLLAEHYGADELRFDADAGDRYAVLILAHLLAGQGRVDEALNTLRTRADGRDHYAIIALADLLAEQGRVDEALDTLRPRADIGDQHAAELLVRMLAEEGLVDELRTRADDGDRHAVLALAGLLAGQGRVDEAVNTLRARADAGDRKAAGLLARILAEHGRVDELRTGADAGDTHAGPTRTEPSP